MKRIREYGIITEKLAVAVYIHNGFGKSQGLVQIEELGTLETPVALTNTLNVGKVVHSLTDLWLSGENPNPSLRGRPDQECECQ